MRVLLDENLPKRLKLDLPEYDVFTVRAMGWSGVKNGELLKLMLKTTLKFSLHSTKIYSTSKILVNTQSR